MMWEQKIIDKQCESTKRIMLAQNKRPLEDDDAYISLIKFTPIAKEAQCVKEDGTVDLNVRELSQKEADFHQAARRARFGKENNKTGNPSTWGTISQEKREKAIMAFMAGATLDAIKRKFKEVMAMFKAPTHDEIMEDLVKDRRSKW